MTLLIVCFSASIALLLIALAVFIWLYLRTQGEKDQVLAAIEEIRAERDRERLDLTQRLPSPREEAPRPGPALQIRREIYNLVTIGTSGCGKTALTFKWANPTSDLGEVIATTSDRFEKTVSRLIRPETGEVVDHVFEILDWGGEFIGDAQNVLLTIDRIRAVIFVVDIGGYDPNLRTQAVSRERVHYQIERFNPHVLPLFFSKHITAHCKTFVLFINKADLLSGTWRQIEAQARELYRPLIDALMAFQGRDGVSIEIMVGSAFAGNGTHELSGLLIRRILPAEEFDEQLRARLRGAMDRTEAQRPKSEDGGPRQQEPPTLVLTEVHDTQQGLEVV